jgi:Holliday junction resolvase RusA-like endonuclease
MGISPKDILSFYIHVDKIPSENELYKPATTKYGKSYLYKPSTIKKFQKEVKVQLLEQLKLYDFNKESINFMEMDLYFLLKNKFWKRDTTKMVKALEDAIKEAIELDDSLNVAISSRKINNSCLLLDKKETVLIFIKIF